MKMSSNAVPINCLLTQVKLTTDLIIKTNICNPVYRRSWLDNMLFIEIIAEYKGIGDNAFVEWISQVSLQNILTWKL